MGADQNETDLLRRELEGLCKHAWFTYLIQWWQIKPAP